MVASNIGCTIGEVNLYDPLHTVVSTTTQMLLKKCLEVLQLHCHNVQYKVAVMTVDCSPLSFVLHLV